MQHHEITEFSSDGERSLADNWLQNQRMRRGGLSQAAAITGLFGRGQSGGGSPIGR
jgi:hypothetical protein